MIRVALVPHQSVTLPVSVEQLAACLQEYVTAHLAPAWGVEAEVVTGGIEDFSDCWKLVLADDSDQAEALGYHLDQAGIPCGYVFCRTAAEAGDHVATVASHELAEMLCDPGCNLIYQSPRGRRVGFEICDPVQDTYIEVKGLPCAGFVLRSWWDSTGQAPYDAAGKCRQPWQILPGGYVPVWTGAGWSSLFGSIEALERFEKRGGKSRLKRTHRRQTQAVSNRPFRLANQGGNHGETGPGGSALGMAIGVGGLAGI